MPRAPRYVFIVTVTPKADPRGAFVVQALAGALATMDPKSAFLHLCEDLLCGGPDLPLTVDVTAHVDA